MRRSWRECTQAEKEMKYIRELEMNSKELSIDTPAIIRTLYPLPFTSILISTNNQIRAEQLP